MPIKLLTARELAERIDVRYSQVLMLARGGEIPSIKVGAEYYFNLASTVKAIRAKSHAEPIMASA